MATSKIPEQLKSFKNVVQYTPLKEEPPPAPLLEYIQPQVILTTPPTKNSDPFAVAAEVTCSLGSARVCVCVPGTRFDTHGTRHGRGGGWYDRFLSAIPKRWIRIGMCFEDQFSPNPLPRQSWDESMDWIVLFKDFDTTYYKTGTRPHI